MQKIDNIFMNSENIKTSDSQSNITIIINLSDKINLKRVINKLLYQILAFIMHGKI